MQSRKLLRLFEHDPLFFNESVILTYPKGEHFELTHAYRSAAGIFHTKSKGRYYELINEGIKFRQYVGALQILDLTIEVLPKIDRPTNVENVDVNWHDVLLEMLKACKILKPKNDQMADLKLRPNSILELYIGLYINELEALINSGLIKKYRKIEENQFVLRGALMFNQQMKYNLVHAEKFYTRHFVYDRNHKLHQVLFQALEVCDHLIHSGFLSDKIKRLMAIWPVAKTVVINEQTFESFKFDRKTQDYQSALQIARLLLLNFHPDIRGGRDKVFALMFDMNKLWEEFVYRQLKAAESTSGFRVIRQSSVEVWQLTNEDDARTVKPDLVLDYGTGAQLKRTVIDTKWKCPDDGRPGDDDLKQMMVYKLYYHADEALLLYPTNEKTYIKKGLFKSEIFEPYVIEEKKAWKPDLMPDNHVAFLNLLNPEGSLKNTQDLVAEFSIIGI
jgi:5-methylcytosine-specific restriction enzyme subunit McrC